MVAGHRRMLLPMAGMIMAQAAAMTAMTMPGSGRGQSYDDWTDDLRREGEEMERRRYQYRYDAHYIAYRQHLHHMHMREIRERKEAKRREQDAATITQAETKRLRKRAKRMKDKPAYACLQEL